MRCSVGKGRWVGVDLGGTWVRVVIANGKGNFLARVREKVDTSGCEAVSSQIVRLARSLCTEAGCDIRKMKGVGIVSAGPIDQKDGVLVNPPNLKLGRIPLTKPIMEQLKLPACLINDCAGAALAERNIGAAKKVDNFVYVTLSTGIGGGVIVNGSLLLGKDGNSHEIGHFVIDCEGRLTCGCGRKGHWEAYCSGKNIPNFVRMRLEEMSKKTVSASLLTKRISDLSHLKSADLFDSAKAGDRLSLQLVSEIGTLNAMGFANVINAYDPSLITVGGSVTLKNKRMIMLPIRRRVKDYAINRLPEMLVTRLGEDVGVHGAIAAASVYLKG